MKNLQNKAKKFKRESEIGKKISSVPDLLLFPNPVYNWQPIEADLDFGIKYSNLKNFDKLVEKYYLKAGNKK
ncbi:MAG: hypothetical protein QME61_03660 [Patescibacteria group bacterium]|nr:hypothetical protein [Patescibacteria group bacterium]